MVIVYVGIVCFAFANLGPLTSKLIRFSNVISNMGKVYSSISRTLIRNSESVRYLACVVFEFY